MCVRKVPLSGHHTLRPGRQATLNFAMRHGDAGRGHFRRFVPTKILNFGASSLISNDLCWRTVDVGPLAFDYS